MKLPEYPRTLHLGDSGGGRSKHHCDFAEVAGLHLVIEEKVDGSHCGLLFDEQAELRVFTRNTVLESPPVRRDFCLLDQLAREATDELWEVLGDRYVLYGEWARVAHTIYYDALPAYFLEDDIFDREAGRFLSTARREALVAALPPAFSRSVAVLHTGSLAELAELHALVGPSNYKSGCWRERCPDPAGRGKARVYVGGGVMHARELFPGLLGAVEDSDEMEGLYIKQEDPDFVLRRLKWVRPAFLAHIDAAGEHWRARDEVLNRLAAE